MKIKFLKLKSWLLAGVMGALGLSSCHCNKQLAEPEEPETPEVKDRGDVRLMYGVPTMNYMIRGQVRDDKGRPVRDVRVGVLEHGIEASADTVYGDPDNVRSYLENTSVKTDKHGRFELSGSSRPWDEMRVLVRDVDGRENGNYKNQLLDVKVQPEDMDRSDAAGMYQGTFRKELKIDLEKKVE
ncbi:MAG: radical SAM-associated putative lipoprotein [Bacteroidales bacterium]|nr:radical SAM-associated putative lipoprotein [Bacteroidales bacterium]